MATRVRPSLKDSKQYKILRVKCNSTGSFSNGSRSNRSRSNGSHSSGRNITFRRLTVLWVQQNGVPFNTTGFFATLSRNGVVVATARFDNFGVARFNNIETLTRVSFTLRTFNRNGVLFRTRTIPAGVEAFAIIG